MNEQSSRGSGRLHKGRVGASGVGKQSGGKNGARGALLARTSCPPGSSWPMGTAPRSPSQGRAAAGTRPCQTGSLAPFPRPPFVHSRSLCPILAMPNAGCAPARSGGEAGSREGEGPTGSGVGCAGRGSRLLRESLALLLGGCRWEWGSRRLMPRAPRRLAFAASFSAWKTAAAAG